MTCVMRSSAIWQSGPVDSTSKWVASRLWALGEHKGRHRNIKSIQYAKSINGKRFLQKKILIYLQSPPSFFLYEYATQQTLISKNFFIRIVIARFRHSNASILVTCKFWLVPAKQGKFDMNYFTIHLHAEVFSKNAP